MSYEIRIKASALKAIKKLERRIRARIAARIVELADGPRARGCKRLAGPDSFYRVRVGDYRIVYEVSDDVLVVLVLKVGHRRDVYRSG
ncbi:MAG: type II toxin-antitoxin system RelE family toxin [Planctomycetota bacterium]